MTFNCSCQGISHINWIRLRGSVTWLVTRSHHPNFLLIWAEIYIISSCTTDVDSRIVSSACVCCLIVCACRNWNSHIKSALCIFCLTTPLKVICPAVVSTNLEADLCELNILRHIPFAFLSEYHIRVTISPIIVAICTAYSPNYSNLHMLYRL